MAAGLEKRALQIVVAVLCAVPLLAGGGGVLIGPEFVGPAAERGTDLDSQFRYLSGLLLGLGFVFLSTVPGIERKGRRFRLAAAVVLVGGLARLWSLLVAGLPLPPHLAALVVELGVVPLLALWQGRVARQAGRRV
ncbi:MAG: DUF4345 domain-containing protein [Alphaproteobacteria bacterium]|nr:DUF4345 domain-containing protein [Alphaproteobacteria bacterium]